LPACGELSSIYQADRLINSRTEVKIATVQAASEEDVDRAVEAARAALKHVSWKHLPGTDRGTLMAKLADLLEENKKLFATIDAWDNGTLNLLFLRAGPLRKQETNYVQENHTV
jgi:aldehyde dehydrogenase (NAD+)